jgi:hypothetical protein
MAASSAFMGGAEIVTVANPFVVSTTMRPMSFPHGE